MLKTRNTCFLLEDVLPQLIHLHPEGLEELAAALPDLLAAPVPRIWGHLHLNIEVYNHTSTLRDWRSLLRLCLTSWLLLFPGYGDTCT
jgi:hypothetical protein